MPQYKSRREEVINSIIPLPQSASQVATRGQTQRRSDKPDSQLTRKLKEELKTDSWFNDNRSLLTYRDDLPWKGSKLYLPTSLRIQALQRSHDAKQASHFGFLKTLHLVQQQFWWPGMKKDIESYVQSDFWFAIAAPQMQEDELRLSRRICSSGGPWKG
ncbi:hypothetical protein NXF25_019091 [Crotalus adamanteus]|uniref:Gypsy retrotransposon integrase-like protein 1 n=1 Tax=Crotalus adamanteus TaxID=8729 RepID=A0AAW1B183_CROAD